MITLLTGGSACGKSTYAESVCTAGPGRRFYIAAMMPYGEESEARIARHRLMRDKSGFETIERYTDMASLALPARGTALLECLCNLTANEMFSPEGTGADAENAVIRGIEHIASQCDRLVVVTNDVGSDGGGYDESTMEYVRVLGRINRRAALLADNVLELVAGIPIVLKGELPI